MCETERDTQTHAVGVGVGAGVGAGVDGEQTTDGPPGRGSNSYSILNCVTSVNLCVCPFLCLSLSLPLSHTLTHAVIDPSTADSLGVDMSEPSSS